MDSIDKIKAAIKDNELIKEGERVVVGVSGGADSVCLLLVLKEIMPLECITAVHINHGIRGDEAARDEDFVLQLCKRQGIRLEIRRLDVPLFARDNKISEEEAGRILRYRVFEEIRLLYKADKIAVAHNLNDVAETFLMNVTRGTGTSGLASIPRRRNRIVRPLLGFTHLELCNYLIERGISWREDLTNADTYYLRSYIRHEILPRLEVKNPQVLSAISGACDIVSDEDAYVSGVAARCLRKLTVREYDGYMVLDAARLAATDVVIARRVIRLAVKRLADDPRLEARHVESVLMAVANGRGAVNLPQDIQARIEFGTLTLAKVYRKERAGNIPAGVHDAHTHMSETSFSAWLSVPGEQRLTQNRRLRARLIPVEHGLDVVSFARAHGREWLGESVLLDAEAAGIDATHGGRLWIEPPCAGDVLCPLGMHGQSKKLSDLLSASRLPVAERRGVPVVRTSPNGRIVWVAGIRADERSKCTQDTKVLLELSIHESLITVSDNYGG